MSGHMMSNSKPYLSFVIFASLLYFHHVLTNELPEGCSSSDYHSSNGLQWTIPSSELPQAKTDQYTSKLFSYFPSGRPPRKRHSPPHSSCSRRRRSSSPSPSPSAPPKLNKMYFGRPIESPPFPPLPTLPPISYPDHGMLSHLY
ncbi:hypothetical protein PIB30_048696 [Stylosanthes scabra]|uniref:Uncharacterized protein n=1 Tax=Stylosanthes scabra TaxID=79078 RepID=A0ABU6SH06_9FABA|nr:hypothetical protein [Stylosanthes scabra]